MSRQVGSPRKLTQPQIRRVLRWHARRVVFQRQHGTVCSLALSMGASVHAVRRALCEDSVATVAPLSDAQRKIAKRWQARYRRFCATQLSADALARALGVSRSTIFDCIRRQGRYHTRSTYSVASVDVSHRTNLLKGWRVVDTGTVRRKSAHRLRRPPAAGS